MARQKRFEQSGVNFQNALELVTNPESQALGHIEWGNLLALQANYTKAQSLVETGLALGRTVEHHALEAHALLGLGFIDFQLGHYSEAERQLQAARLICQKIDNLSLLSDALNHSYALAAAQNKIVSALANLADLEKAVHQLGDRKGEAIVAHFQSNIYNPLGMYAEAIDAATKGLTIIQELGDPEFESFILHMLGDSYRCVGQLEDAERVGERALQLAESQASPLPTAFALTYLAATQEALGNDEQAGQSYQRASQLFQRLGKPFAALEPLSGLAHLLMQRGHLAEAVEIVEDILGTLKGEAVTGVDHPLRVYWHCYAVLSAADDKRADVVLYRANRVLTEIKGKLTDRAMRNTFSTANAATLNLIAALKNATQPSAVHANPTLSSQEMTAIDLS